MRTNRLGFLLLAAGLASTAPAQRVAVTIDAAKPQAPISRLMFGGFIEPATTAIWAEMLSDRKFFNEINSQPDAAPPAGAGRMMGAARRWRPIGPDGFVTADRAHAYVGEHSPMVRLEPATPHGIAQTGLALRGGQAYSGRIVVAGSPGAKVGVTLIWGTNPGDRQTVTLDSLSSRYTTFPLKFTAAADSDSGALEIAGAGSGSFHIGAVSLMVADNVEGFRPGMIRKLKEQGITLTRWPGGNFVSAYDWRDGIGDPDKRPTRMDPVWRRLEPNDVGIDEYVALDRLLGAEPYIAANTGFGDARSAADEVEYVNGSPDTPMGKLRAANGHREPYNVKIWGIGNEMYGPWQFGYMSIDQYWVKHNMIVQAMKKVDPTIQVIGAGASIEEVSWCAIEEEQFSRRAKLSMKLPIEYGSAADWTGAMLAHSADYMDLLSEHFYAYPLMAFDAAAQHFVDVNDPLADQVRRLPNKVEFKFEAWQEYLKRMPFLKDKNIKFAFDEWSPRMQTAQGGRGAAGGAPQAGGRAAAGAGGGSAAMSSPLSLALTYHEMFRHSDMVALSVNTGGMRGVATDRTGDGTGFRLEGLVMKIMHDHFSDSMPVSVTGNSPQRPIKGTVGVDTSAQPSGSPTYPLDVFAALSADRKKLLISIVNPTESVQEADLSITGAQASGHVRMWQITAPEASAVNAAIQGLSEIPVSQAPGRVAAPPASVSVYELELR
jgi:alpha-N-arabinofuranosidase